MSAGTPDALRSMDMNEDSLKKETADDYKSKNGLRPEKIFSPKDRWIRIARANGSLAGKTGCPIPSRFAGQRAEFNERKKAPYPECRFLLIDTIEKMQHSVI
jgi:hypothetical protein